MRSASLPPAAVPESVQTLPAPAGWTRPLSPQARAAVLLGDSGLPELGEGCPCSSFPHPGTHSLPGCQGMLALPAVPVMSCFVGPDLRSAIVPWAVQRPCLALLLSSSPPDPRGALCSSGHRADTHLRPGRSPLLSGRGSHPSAVCASHSVLSPSCHSSRGKEPMSPSLVPAESQGRHAQICVEVGAGAKTIHEAESCVLLPEDWAGDGSGSLCLLTGKFRCSDAFAGGNAFFPQVLTSSTSSRRRRGRTATWG